MKVQEITDIAPQREFVESKLLHFQRLGTEFFGINENERPEKPDDYIEYLIKNNVFKLPFELNEFHIDIKNLGKSFLVEYYYLNESSKKSNELRKIQFLNKQVETYFHKWVATQNFEARLFYSHSIMEKIQNDYSKIINILITAFIYAEEETLINLNEAAKLFDKAITIFGRMSNKTKITDRILYILHIFNGLVHLKMKELEEANFYFIESMNYNKWAQNAKFYLAYSFAMQGDSEKAADYLQQIFELDTKRLDFFITTNQLRLFKFFVNNCFLTHIFEFSNFSNQYEFIEQLVMEKIDYGYNARVRVEKKMIGLNEKKVAKYLGAAHLKDISFVNKIIADYKTSNNFWILASFETIENKIDKIIDSIIKNIEDFYKNKLEKHRKLYDEKINDEKKRIADLENTLNNSIKKIENEFNEKKKELEQQVQNKINLLTLEISNLEKSKNEVSIKTFSNSMLYTFMIAMFVFLTGGFAEYTADYSVETSRFSSAIIIIIAHGLKWGIMTFIVGMFVSAFSVVSSVLKIFTKKQRIQNQLDKADSILKIGLQQLENEAERSKKYHIERNRAIMENHKKNIENLEKEKSHKIAELEKEYIALTEDEKAPFVELKEIV